jgi:hypothetical protein
MTRRALDPFCWISRGRRSIIACTRDGMQVVYTTHTHTILVLVACLALINIFPWRGRQNKPTPAPATLSRPRMLPQACKTLCCRSQVGDMKNIESCEMLTVVVQC